MLNRRLSMLIPPCLSLVPDSKNLVEMAGASAAIHDLEVTLRMAAYLPKEAKQKDKRIQRSPYYQNCHTGPGVPAL